MVSGGKSVRCPDNCLTCNPNNVTNCLYCRQGYFKSNNVCFPFNTPQCMIFDTDNNIDCLVCMPGYALTEAKVCIQCASGCF